MNEREECLEYLKNEFLTGKVPDSTPENMRAEKANLTEDHWKEIPEWHKDWMIDLVLGFKGGGNKFQLIKKEFDKKVHSDTSFGMTVKDILSKK